MLINASVMSIVRPDKQNASQPPKRRMSILYACTANLAIDTSYLFYKEYIYYEPPLYCRERNTCICY